MGLSQAAISRNGRVGRHRLRAGLPVPHVRGRGVRHPDRLDGHHADGPPQGPRLSRVRLSVTRSAPARRSTRTARSRPDTSGDERHLPDVPLHRSDVRQSSGKYPSFNGDRILVGKFAYQFSDPERWDVIVFKFPGEAQTNYIKRLVGLPGETIRIRHGDLCVKRAGRERSSTIARKPPDKLLAMLQPVYDNDLRCPKHRRAGAGRRAGSSAARTAARPALAGLDDDRRASRPTAGPARKRGCAISISFRRTSNGRRDRPTEARRRTDRPSRS